MKLIFCLACRRLRFVNGSNCKGNPCLFLLNRLIFLNTELSETDYLHFFCVTSGDTILNHVLFKNFTLPKERVGKISFVTPRLVSFVHYIITGIFHKATI